VKKIFRLFDTFAIRKWYVILGHMNKVVKNSEEAIRGIQDGMTVAFGGFGLCGIPENCIAALVKSGVKNLTCISNNAGVDDFGLGLLLKGRQIKKMISSYVGENAEFERQMLSGELEVDLIPQGYPGHPAAGCRLRHAGLFYSRRRRHGGGGRKRIQEVLFNGEEKEYLMEMAFEPQFSVVKAWKGDHHGNIIFRLTARNFSPLVAMAGKTDYRGGRRTCRARTAGPATDPCAGNLCA
jgi:3-oxoacid CoA-transferase subunit A